MDWVRQAERLATVAHHGQLDKGGNPYILHPQEVARGTTCEIDRTVAWLHDVVEDTCITLDDLSKFGFPDEVVVAVDAITRREGESRGDYMHRLIKNEVAIRVKLLDIRHNMDLSRLAEVTTKDVERNRRYQQELEELESIYESYI